MADAAAPRTPSWAQKSKAVRAQPIPSGPIIKPTLSAETLEAITVEALSLAQTSLIGIAPTKHPSRVELQDWVNVNLVDPSMLVTRIRMLPRGYFVLTFATEEGATGALQMSPLSFGSHSLFLHPWSPQFDPTKPKGYPYPNMDSLPDIRGYLVDESITGSHDASSLCRVIFTNFLFAQSAFFTSRTGHEGLES
jgi:hypothetical protein